jgi:hypothetical protein
MRILIIAKFLLTTFLLFAHSTDSVVKYEEKKNTRVMQLYYCTKTKCGNIHEFFPSPKMNCFEVFIFEEAKKTSLECLKKIEKMFNNGKFIQVNIDQLPQNLLNNISK